MNIDRSSGRNVHFYDALAPGVALGGLIQNGSITEKNFLDILGIVLVATAPIRVKKRTSSYVLARTDQPLQTGDYDVYCDGRRSLSKRFDRSLTFKKKQIPLKLLMSHGKSVL